MLFMQISLDSLNATIVHPRDVFRFDVYAGAASIIVIPITHQVIPRHLNRIYC
jgi:DNA repair protein RadC